MKKTLLAFMAMVSLCSHAQAPMEGFENPWTGSPAAPPGWTVVNEWGPNVTWQQSIGNEPDSPPYGGNHAAYLQRENIAPTAPNPKDWLISPSFSITQNAQLQFYSRLTIDGDQGSIYKVLIGTDSSDLNSFTEIYSATELEINPVQQEYTLKYVTIPATYVGMNMHIAFVMTGDDGDRWFIDNVSILAACSAPSQLGAANITPDGADLFWTENGTATQWEIDMVPADGVPSGQGIVVTTNPFHVTTNTAGTPLESGVYKFFIRSTCADGGHSQWVGPFYFSTDMAFNNIVHGIVRYDANEDGICDGADPVLPNAQIAVTIDGDYAYTVFSNSSGTYELYGIEDGEHTVSLQIAEQMGFPDIPVLVEDITFDEEINEWDIAHCLPQMESVNDLAVTINAWGNPVPGFDVYYNYMVINKGNEINNDVTVTVNFDTSRIDYVPVESSSYPVVASGNTLTITLGQVLPSLTKSGVLKFHVKEPPVNTGGEELVFTGSLSEVQDDANIQDNAVVYEHIITNSYDPNDITVHEGKEIPESQADDYLTYTIRFQNKGNGNAINIRIDNTLDDLLDWDTFQPIASSHNYTVKRTGNELEFFYPNIQLPFELANEPASHGFVTYRIKPKAEFGLDDTISNEAGIYFDFNPVIMTNVATTKVVALAGLNDNALAIAKLYPNPVKDQLHIEVRDGELQLVTVHDINGRLCLSANAGTIDTAALTGGIYFVKVTTDRGSANYKIIKQ